MGVYDQDIITITPYTVNSVTKQETAGTPASYPCHVTIKNQKISNRFGQEIEAKLLVQIWAKNYTPSYADKFVLANKNGQAYFDGRQMEIVMIKQPDNLGNGYWEVWA